MKFVIFAIQILIGIESAFAIKCYQCTPDFSNVSSAISALVGMGGTPTICGQPNVTTECTGGQDSCVTLTITGKVPFIGKVTLHSLTCGAKMTCNDMVKNMACSGMRNATEGSGGEITGCDRTCCQDDLCNKPVVPSPALNSTAGPTTQSPAGKTTVKSSAKSTCFQTSFAMFWILGVVSVAFMNIF